jgi:hypothetical protein
MSNRSEIFMDVVTPQENQLAIYSDFLRHFLQSYSQNTAIGVLQDPTLTLKG